MSNQTVLAKSFPVTVAALILSLLAGGAFLTWWMVVRTEGEMRAGLLQQTRLVAQAVNLEHIQALSGGERDSNSPHYQRLKEEFASVRSANHLCRMVYLLGRKADGSLFFFVDSEPAGSKDCSPPGQIYDRAAQGGRRCFALQMEAVEGPYTDQFGKWVSTFVPILDPRTAICGQGEILAVLGMDVDARAWAWMLVRAALAPVMFTLALVAIVLTGRMLLVRRSLFTGTPGRWMGHIELFLAVAVGLVVTWFGSWVAYERQVHDRNEAFVQLASSRTAAITETLQNLRTAQLEGLAHFYENCPTVTPEEFRRFTAYLAKDPAIQAWEWVPAVSAADKSRFEEEVRAAGWNEFEIWQKDEQGKPVQAVDRDVFYPVFLVNPLAGNERALGFDLGSEPLRGVALEIAARTELPTGTDPVTLVQEAGNQKGIGVYRPVFAGDSPKRLRGFAAAVLRMGTLLKSAGADQSAPMELSLLRNDAAPELLATTYDDGNAPASGLVVTRPVFAFGKVFAVTAHAGLQFMQLHPAPAGRRCAIGGLLLTAALATVIGALRRRREELEHLVFERTNELRKLSQAVEQSPSVVVITDTMGNIEYVNPKFTEITGYSFDEALGANPRILKSGQYPREAYKTLWDTITAGREWRGEFCNRKKNGELYWEAASICPITDEKGVIRHFVAVKEDVTKRREAENTMMEAKEIAERANRLKSEFLANVSHEIRTPMNGVIGLTGLLLDTPLDPQQRDYARMISASAEALLTIINDILDFSKIEARKLTLDILDFDLHWLIEGAVAINAERAQSKGIELASRVNPALSSRYRGDPGRLRQVLINLLSNAIKFTECGEVVLWVSKVDETANEEFLRFEIRDTGIGMTQETQSRLFQPFNQADGSTTRKYGGTGLGLAICKQLVAMMDGEIGAASQPGNGSIFWFTVKLEKHIIAPESHGDTDIARSEGFEPRRDVRILFAEDNPVNRFVTIAHLQRLGYRTDVASNGREVLDLLRQTPYDIIFMDCQMPEMDGYETTRRIRADRKNPCRPYIVALTAHTLHAAAKQCLEAGMNDCLSKPVRFAVFAAALTKGILALSGAGE